MKRIYLLLHLTLLAPLSMSFTVEAKVRSSDRSSVTSLKTKSSLILDELIDSGIVQIHTLNLVKLRKEFNKISWYVTNRLPQEFQFKGREWANYSVNEKMVLYISRTLAQDPYLTKLFALHEALGANDIFDQNLEISFLLSLALKNFEVFESTKEELIAALGSILLDPKHAVSAHKSRFFIIDKDQFQIAGGVTSVGGGGDFRALEFKAKLFKKVLTYHYTFNQILHFLKMEIEVDPLNQTQHIQPNWEMRFPDRRMIEAVASLKTECAGPNASFLLKFKDTAGDHKVMDDCIFSKSNTGYVPADWVIFPTIHLKVNLPSTIGEMSPQPKSELVREAFEVYSLTYGDPYLSPLGADSVSLKYRCGKVAMIIGQSDNPQFEFMRSSLERQFVNYCNTYSNGVSQ